MDKIVVEWYTNPDSGIVYDNVIVMIFVQPVDWGQFHEALKEVHTLIASKPHNVHLIIHPQAALPAGNPVTHFSTAFKKQPENTGKVVVLDPVGVGWVMGFMKRLALIMTKLFPDKSPVLFTESYEDALRLLKVEEKVIQPL